MSQPRPADAPPPAEQVRTTDTSAMTVSVDGDVVTVTVTVHGDFDAATSTDAVDQFTRAAAGRNLELLRVEMTNAGFVDSSGLGALVRLRQEARRRGARTQLVGLDPRLHKLLQLTGLDRDFNVHPIG